MLIHEPRIMSTNRPKQYLASTQRAVANADAIEWEELPSLAGSLAQRLVQRGSWAGAPVVGRGANDSAFGNSTSFGSPWDNTMPAALDPTPQSQPFREAVAGLATREVLDPEVFQHFFGPDALPR
jgi:hypothetical protein